MDYDSYDNDANPSDDDYFTYVLWLQHLTAAELRQTKGNPHEERQAVLRYWRRGLRANLSSGELIDFLGADTPSILDMAEYTIEEGDTLMRVSDSITDAEVMQTPLLRPEGDKT